MRRVLVALAVMVMIAIFMVARGQPNPKVPLPEIPLAASGLIPS